ncbi:tyrosine-type recombinase/integrase [Klebsiella pneumoniae]|uniref:tyrosine-type recombinase/integrase n=2 Tax=Klebsiella pneumoniae TaxID=573 RepID=UPI001CDB2B11|nr:hypothetical protein [Klebsiella pneumoniae]
MIRIPERSIKATQLAKKLSDTTAFEAIDFEWYSTKVSGWSKSYADYVKRAFKNNVFPYPGSQLVNEIKPLELLSVLQRMEKRGAPELTNKVLQHCSEVFRYAIVTGRAEYNPAADLGRVSIT